jgi:hypothetical protein
MGRLVYLKEYDLANWKEPKVALIMQAESGTLRRWQADGSFASGVLYQ